MITDDILAYERQGEHKGENGTVLVVAGSENYAGAAVLTATACEAVLRSGADLCVACCPEKVAWLVNNQLPDAVTHKFSGSTFSQQHVARVIELAKDCDVGLVGPGLGDEARGFAHDVLTELPIPVVIDADGIRAVTVDEVDDAVFTGHADEYSDLLHRSEIQEEHLQARLGGSTVVKKGPVDRIISAEQVEENQTGNQVMTKGGTGDVLAGLIAGFTAQGRALFDAACAGAYLNGAVCDRLEQEKGQTFIASDIAENLDIVL